MLFLYYTRCVKETHGPARSHSSLTHLVFKDLKDLQGKKLSFWCLDLAFLFYVSFGGAFAWWEVVLERLNISNRANCRGRGKLL